MTDETGMTQYEGSIVSMEPPISYRDEITGIVPAIIRVRKGYSINQEFFVKAEIFGEVPTFSVVKFKVQIDCGDEYLY